MAAKRTLWPKEHGAYAQLGFPLLTALVAGRPTLAAGAFTISSIAAFLAHESGAILLGARGTRARREDGPRAKRWLAGLGSIAVAFGAAGLVLSPRSRTVVVIAVACAALTGLLLYERKERTRAGEIVAATSLAGAAAPVGAACGLSMWWVVVCWAVWAAQSAMSTVAVRALVTRSAAWPTLVVTGVLLAGGALLGPSVAISLAPMGLVCAALVLLSLHPKAVRPAGFALAIAMTVSAASLAIGVRS